MLLLCLHKIITKHHDRAAAYLRYLSREVDLHTQHMGLGQAVSQLHFGGGSPPFCQTPNCVT